MARVYLEKGEQTRFLQQVRGRLAHLTWHQIAEICGVSPATLRGWRKEKNRMSLRALRRLSRLAKVPMPRVQDVISEAERRRRSGQRGGSASHTPPQKTIRHPSQSAKLAELVGILLGDGSISRRHVKVAHNTEKEQAYGHFVAGLFRELFGLKAPIKEMRENTSLVIVSSAALVEYLESLGLKRGNKIAGNIEVPEWIFGSEATMQACVRGLMDTDGSVFLRRLRSTNGGELRYVTLSFGSHSPLLLAGMARMLKTLSFTPFQSSVKVVLSRQREVHRYYKEIGFSNPYHLERYRQFTAMSTARLDRCW